MKSRDVVIALVVVLLLSSKRKGSAAAVAPSTPGELGTVFYPVKGKSRVISPYGARGSEFHYGVDIGADQGTELLAMTQGRVKFGTDPKGGNVAILTRTDGSAVYYAHMDTFAPEGTKAGDARSVLPGEIIGTVGKTGNASATVPHVHIELWPSGAYEKEPPDPSPMLTAAKQVA